jgi:hypothetical protein
LFFNLAPHQFSYVSFHLFSSTSEFLFMCSRKLVAQHPMDICRTAVGYLAKPRKHCVLSAPYLEQDGPAHLSQISASVCDGLASPLYEFEKSQYCPSALVDLCGEDYRKSEMFFIKSSSSMNLEAASFCSP